MTHAEDITVAATKAGADGITSNDLTAAYGWTYPVASSALSRAHSRGVVAGLAETRNNQRVYVLGEHVGERETKAFGHSRALTLAGPGTMPTMEDFVAVIATAFQAAITRVTTDTVTDGILVIDDAEHARLQDAFNRLQAEHESALEKIETLEANPVGIDGETVAEAIEAAAEKAWNGQAKVALMGVADAFRTAGK